MRIEDFSHIWLLLFNEFFLDVGTLSELDMETPEGDAFEQHQEIIADETVTPGRHEIPFDVDEADAAEQERAVGFDDDDYR